jgi:hypothetical protein
MAKAIKLSESIINDARRYGAIYSRSTPKQIEYWAGIGKIAEENPDLSYNFIKDILLSKAEKRENEVTPYHFG